MLVLEMHEWEERSPESHAALRGTFLGDNPAVRDLASELTRREMLELVDLRSGLRVRTTSFVGRLRLGDLHLTIRPKISFDPLLALLRYAFDLRHLTLFSETEYGAPPDAFQELLIHQLAAEASELLARGLLRRYVQVQESLAAPRGRFNMQRIAQQGGVVEAAVPCIHYPRLEDSLINQVLLAGLYLGARLTEDTILRTRLRRLAAVMDEGVSRITLTAEVMRRLDRQLNRLTAAYEPALTIITLLLEGAGTAFVEESFLKLPGFLFDMNHFFERLMSRFLRENLPDYTLHDQYRLQGMMAYHPNYNPQHRRPPTPRPDYVLSQQGRVVAMLDAKYRDIWTHGLPRDMLYQLALYALSQGTGGQSTILYPTMEPLAKPEVITIHEVFHGEHQGQVVLRPVNLMQLEVLITNTTLQGERARTHFAQWLLFG